MAGNASSRKAPHAVGDAPKPALEQTAASAADKRADRKPVAATVAGQAVEAAPKHAVKARKTVAPTNALTRDKQTGGQPRVQVALILCSLPVAVLPESRWPPTKANTRRQMPAGMRSRAERALRTPMPDGSA